MRKHFLSQIGVVYSGIVVALVLSLTGAGLAMLSFAGNPPKWMTARTALAQTAPGWSIISSPNTSVARGNALNDVACASANECWAVGGYNSSGSLNQTLIEKWDGTSWSIISSPNTNSTQDNQLYGVACASANECWAVGYYDSGTARQTLIEKWDGASWSIVSSPNTSTTQSNGLSGVACASANECWAVGDYGNGTANSQTLIERWDGASWSIVSSPNTSTTQDNSFNGVTCASANECWAVGDYTPGSNVPQALIEKWDGASWSIVSSPNTSTTQSNGLLDVTCALVNECWAVGLYDSGSFINQTLIEKWDGTSWSIVISPNTSTTQLNFLEGVTCASANECWAVGFYENQTLIEKWDGTSWSIVSSPNTNSTQDNSLYGVTCASANECWAVGEYDNGTASQTLIEHYTNTVTLKILSITHPASNTIHLQCLGVPNAVNRIEYSLTLSPGSFSLLLPRPAAADGTGAFPYDDTNAGTKKFYRLAPP